jgi:hypothetical protein
LDSEKDTYRDDGSTASTAVLVGDHLYVANVGDSRTVISKGGKGISHAMNCIFHSVVGKYFLDKNFHELPCYFRSYHVTSMFFLMFSFSIGQRSLYLRIISLTEAMSGRELKVLEVL